MIMKVIIDLENCFIACCTKFIQIKFQDPKQDIDFTRALTRNCFYFDNNGIDDNDNMRVTCINASFSDKKNINDFCFFVKKPFCKTLAMIYTLLICLFIDEKNYVFVAVSLTVMFSWHLRRKTYHYMLVYIQIKMVLQVLLSVMILKLLRSVWIVFIMRCSLECLMKVVYMILQDVKLIMPIHHITKGYLALQKLV